LPVIIFEIPSVPASSSGNFWNAFCFNGKDGLKGLTSLNSITQAPLDSQFCQKYYGYRKIKYISNLSIVADVLNLDYVQNDL